MRWIPIVAAFAAAAPAAASTSLLGTYETKLTHAKPAALNATWDVALKAHGRYTIARNGKDVVEGLDTVKGNQISFGHETGPFSCPGGSGTYRWRLTGSSLRLTIVRDTYVGRRLVLATGPLRRVG